MITKLAAPAILVLFIPAQALSADVPLSPKHEAPLKYSMVIDALHGRSTLNPIVKAACNIGQCCCRSGSQIFCTSADACSKMGGACSAGCN